MTVDVDPTGMCSLRYQTPRWTFFPSFPNFVGSNCAIFVEPTYCHGSMKWECKDGMIISKPSYLGGEGISAGYDKDKSRKVLRTLFSCYF